VLNGIGGVDGQDSLRGTQLSGLIVFLSQFLPDIHRELKQITVNGDVPHRFYHLVRAAGHTAGLRGRSR
jgi:hypothetical protein